MLAACLQGYQEVIRDNLEIFGVIWRVTHESSLRGIVAQHGFHERQAWSSRQFRESPPFLFAKTGCSWKKERRSIPTYNYHGTNPYKSHVETVDYTYAVFPHLSCFARG